MTTDGLIGEVPDWYGHIQAAKYLGVSPWELLEQPVIWKEWALTAAGAEGAAQKAKREREDQKRKAERGRRNA